MRHFSYNEYTEDLDANPVVTKSEQEIREEYYPWWYDKMCNKYGQDIVDKNYCFEDCLEDWKTIHYAWESK